MLWWALMLNRHFEEQEEEVILSRFYWIFIRLTADILWALMSYCMTLLYKRRLPVWVLAFLASHSWFNPSTYAWTSWAVMCFLALDLEEMIQVLKLPRASPAPLAVLSSSSSDPLSHISILSTSVSVSLLVSLLCPFLLTPSLFLCAWRLLLPSLVTCCEGRKPHPFPSSSSSTHVFWRA